jgi:serine/threonine-protein kinase RsbW
MQATDILIIHSKKDELKKAEAFLYSFFKGNEIPEKFFKRVYLCLSEAIMNSIHHGNHRDVDKQIIIRVCYKNGLLMNEIHDEGEGFDYSKIENPTNEKNLKKESGRGIHIIKALSKEIEFKNQGQCVRFKIECK